MRQFHSLCTLQQKCSERNKNKDLQNCDRIGHDNVRCRDMRNDKINKTEIENGVAALLGARFNHFETTFCTKQKYSDNTVGNSVRSKDNKITCHTYY